MPEITKQDVKNAVIEALEPLAKSIQTDFQGVNGRLDAIDKCIDAVDGRLGVLEIDAKEIKTDLTDVKTEVKEMKYNSSELFTKIDSFVFMYGKQAEEMTVLAKQSAGFEERISVLEKRSGIQ